ncbi:hypothetical protein [Xanthovirga aplysinae]|uniref:hypothetical protein n=1 Tax=Xanthovirga aplysinae TaxID=2529853 RepID=UPI0012BCA0CD|nr:hypothetical protein [Xanthovirga aplysinae]MTI33394.1 hypothetical protein [Xanthovirga aplysinae]
MKIESTNSLKPFSNMLFFGALALTLSLSSYAGVTKKADSAGISIAYEMILSPEEELALASEAMSPVMEEMISFPQEVFVYDQHNNLIHHATGTEQELQQNIKLQAVIAKCNLLMESGGDKFFVRRK